LSAKPPPARGASPDPQLRQTAPEQLGARAEPGEAVELIWFDREVVPRLRRKAAWRPLLNALERTPLDPDFDDPAFASDPMVIEDRREVFRVLVHGTPLGADDFDAAFRHGLRDDGGYVPCLELVAGELELPFDELASLRVTVTTVAPLVGVDEALKSALLVAREFLGSPGLMSAPAVADGLTKRIEDAFAQGKRVVSAGYLEAQRERALLEQRQYQRRAVFGGKHLRGLLRFGGGEATGKAGTPGKGTASSDWIPAYLPESLAEALPMYPRFRTRAVVELRMATDRYETHPAALRVMALARTGASWKL
jgi:hypothetical protein